MDKETEKQIEDLESQIEEFNKEKNNNFFNSINKLSPGVTALVAFLTLFASILFQFFSIGEKTNSLSYRITNIEKRIEELDSVGTRKSELKFSIIEERMKSQEREIIDLKEQIKEMHNYMKNNVILKRKSDYPFIGRNNNSTTLTELEKRPSTLMTLPKKTF